MPVAPIAAGAGIIGSFLSSNQQKNAAKANQSAESSIDNQIIDIYNSQLGKYNQAFGELNPIGALDKAEAFYSSEVQGGLSPAVIGAAEAGQQQTNAQNLATFKNQLGPYTPNVGGALQDFGNNEIMGNVALQQQLAAMNQSTRQQGAEGLGSIGQGILNWGSNLTSNVASGLGGLGSQFGQAAEENAANVTNPFSSISGLLAAYPNLFGGGNTNTQPNQGGLGATGGSGTQTAGGLGGQTN